MLKILGFIFLCLTILLSGCASSYFERKNCEVIGSYNYCDYTERKVFNISYIRKLQSEIEKKLKSKPLKKDHSLSKKWNNLLRMVISKRRSKGLALLKKPYQDYRAKGLEYDPKYSGMIAVFMGDIIRNKNGSVDFVSSKQKLYLEHKNNSVVKLLSDTYGVKTSEIKNKLNLSDGIESYEVGKQYIADESLIFKEANELLSAFLGWYALGEINAYIDYSAHGIYVDMLGNLYIGRSFLEKLSQSDLDLVLLHEISHLVPVYINGNPFIKEYVMTSVRKRMMKPEYIPIDILGIMNGMENRTSTISPYFHGIAGSLTQNETMVDLFVLSMLDEKYECDAYQNILSNLINHEPQKYRTQFLEVACSQNPSALAKNIKELDDELMSPSNNIDSNKTELGRAFNRSLLSENQKAIDVVIKNYNDIYSNE